MYEYVVTPTIHLESVHVTMKKLIDSKQAPFF